MTASTLHRPRWTETLRDAADLALLGIVVTLASVPVVTAGAAVAAASAAAHDRCVEGDLPSMRTSIRRFGRAIVPGLGATLVLALVVALLALDVRMVSRGTVPGGAPMLVALVVAAGAVLGFVGLTVVEVGRLGGQGWLVAARSATRAGLGRPALLVASAGVGLVALLLALFIPLTAPLALGYALFALHVVAARLAPPGPIPPRD